MTTEDSVRFCPQCGSASVDFSTLVVGGLSGAHCNGCRWEGSAEELLLVPIQHEFQFGKESIVAEMMNDVRQLLSGSLGVPYLKFLLKWGFVKGEVTDIGGTVDRKQFARYLARIGHAVLMAVIDERTKQEKKKNESSS